jgi:hypothetical protein
MGSICGFIRDTVNGTPGAGRSRKLITDGSTPLMNVTHDMNVLVFGIATDNVAL